MRFGGVACARRGYGWGIGAMLEQSSNLTVILGLAILSALIMAYKTMKKFRFWFFDIWADLPIIGTIARWSRMKSPSSDVANARLDKLFHAYWLHIPTPIDEERFDQLRNYLFLARDEQSKPTPTYAWLLLLLLICAESYAFSLLLGVALATGDMSQNQADIIAAGVSFILGIVFLVLAHASGHTLRRANELRRARPHAIDISAPMEAGEKPKKDLGHRLIMSQPYPD